MRDCRFYVNQALKAGELISLGKETANHIAKVLRLKAGQHVHLFNGQQAGYFQAELIEISKQSVKAKLASFIESHTESPLQLHLGQAIGKAGKMELVIQKAVELGVQHITPLISEFSQVKLSAERWEKKRQHWQKVAISACEQCERNQLPTIAPITALTPWLEQREEQAKLILHPRASSNFETPDSLQSAALLIGPEGGFSEQELQQAQDKGFARLKLGPRILRTETAAIAAVSVIQHQFGDF